MREHEIPGSHGPRRAAPGRWRSRRIGVAALGVGLSLILGPGAVSTAQSNRALAAVLHIEVTPRNDPQVVCIGQTVQLLVQIRITGFGNHLLNFGSLLLSNVPRMTNTSPTIATVVRQAARQENYGVIEPYNGERYDLRGKKAGTGSVTFSASGGGGRTGMPFQRASTTVAYKVVPCDYKVGAVHIMTSDDPTDGSAVAVMEPVVVTADEAGRLSGTGTLAWAATPPRSPGCTTRLQYEPSSEVGITGEVDEAGRVSLRFIHEGVDWSSQTKCRGRNQIGADAEGRHELAALKVTGSAEGDSIQADAKSTIHLGVLSLKTGDDVIVTLEPVES